MAITSPLGLEILFVEDNEEIREALVSLLEEEGYAVTPATTAEEGLSRMQATPFHLVITDYSLPGQTGTWMIREARRLSVLREAQVLMVTAHPNPEADGLRVIRKPLDLDDFLREIDDLLAPARASELEKARHHLSTSAPVRASDGVRAELTLYISSASPSSLKALRNMRALLDQYRSSQVRFTVCDLLQDPGSVRDEDRIAFTPTLIKRSPGPKTWILGDLEDSSAVSDLLSYAGVDKAR